VPTLAAYPGMMQRARNREGLRVCRAAWLVGVSVREYREIEAGDRTPSPRTYERNLRAVRVAADVCETTLSQAACARSHGGLVSVHD
jgi:Helix-turn-helix domain